MTQCLVVGGFFSIASNWVGAPGMFTSVTADVISHNPGWIGASAWAALAAKMDAPAMAAAANWRMDILPIEIVARPCSSSLNSGFQCLEIGRASCRERVCQYV